MAAATLTLNDLIVAPGKGEKTASDMVIVLRSAKLAGHFSIMEGEVRPKELLGFHTHANEDQHMYIISGELHLEVGGEKGVRFTAGAGCHVFKPRGITHGFWNVGNETVRYIETSTQDGFERFIDSRSGGLGSMVSGATKNLGMSFETGRTVAVMKEFALTGLAGANLANPEELLKDPAFAEMMRTHKDVRELVFYLGGAKLKEKLKSLFA